MEDSPSAEAVGWRFDVDSEPEIDASGSGSGSGFGPGPGSRLPEESKHAHAFEDKPPPPAVVSVAEEARQLVDCVLGLEDLQQPQGEVRFEEVGVSLSVDEASALQDADELEQGAAEEQLLLGGTRDCNRDHKAGHGRDSSKGKGAGRHRDRDWGSETIEDTCCDDWVRVTFCCNSGTDDSSQGSSDRVPVFGANLHGFNIYAIWFWGVPVCYCSQLLYVFISYLLSSKENENWAATPYFTIVLSLMVMLLLWCCVRSGGSDEAKGRFFTVLLTCLSTLPAGIAGIIWEKNVKLALPLDMHEIDAHAGWLVFAVCPILWPLIVCALLVITFLCGSFIVFLNPPGDKAKKNTYMITKR